MVPMLVCAQNKSHWDARSHGQVLRRLGDGVVEWDAEERGSTQTQSRQFDQLLSAS